MMFLEPVARLCWLGIDKTKAEKKKKGFSFQCPLKSDFRGTCGGKSTR